MNQHKRLNLGAGPKKNDRYTSVDALEWDGKTDIIHDLTVYPYPFDRGSVEEIVMIEVLEHISFRDTHKVLKECYRIMKPGAKLHIQVPDCASMMRAYINDRISDDIPHKGDEKSIIQAQDFTGNVVNPNRWLFAFCGAQKHPYDTHKAIFTPEGLQEDCHKAGFSEVVLLEDKMQWKIKINCIK